MKTTTTTNTTTTTTGSKVSQQLDIYVATGSPIPNNIQGCGSYGSTIKMTQSSSPYTIKATGHQCTTDDLELTIAFTPQSWSLVQGTTS
jgi:hypothetical protein